MACIADYDSKKESHCPPSLIRAATADVATVASQRPPPPLTELNVLETI